MILRPVLIATSLVLAGHLFAQAPAPKVTFPAASQAATIKQRVGITDIEVEYSRPGMKGRKIFGELEPYDVVWRTGANSATKVTFSTPVKVNGQALTAGSYELFSIPGKSEWTVIFQKKQEKAQWGGYSYDPKNDTVRLAVKPVTLPSPMETFSIGFGDLTNSSANFYFAWEKTRVNMKIEVDTVGLVLPQIKAAMAAEGKKPYANAAMFYFENNLDLKQAVAWMDAAIAENPESFPVIYRKGLILQKMGDKAGAKAAAERSLEVVAKQKDSPLKDEYTRLNKRLLASLN